MSIGERDPHTGHMMTGHEWNGIKELNTPVPKAVYVFLAAAFLFGVVYWVLMPAWPLGVTYTKGLLGIDQRTTVAAKLEQADKERAVWTTRLAAAGYADIQADPDLMRIVRETGHTLFGDNCAACHGATAEGGPGFPNLAAAPFMWGGDPATLEETLRVGINATHAETRTSQMLAFGQEQMLSRAEIDSLVPYVESLSNPAGKPAGAAAAHELFVANCASCHGEDGKGIAEMGAPNLTDRYWTYGGDAQSILTTVFHGRQGHMPAWEGRLAPLDRKILVLYLLDLRAARKP